MNVYTLREVSRIMTDRLWRQGTPREVTEQVVRLAYKKGTIPARRTKLGILIDEDALARLRVKLSGPARQDPVFFTMPPPVDGLPPWDDVLTQDEVIAGLPDWKRNTVRYHLRETQGMHPERGRGGFIDAYQVRRNWLLPVWAVRDGNGQVLAWEARWKDGSLCTIMTSARREQAMARQKAWAERSIPSKTLNVSEERQIAGENALAREMREIREGVMVESETDIKEQP